MKVFVLVPISVYDQGIIGVYASEEEARQAAEYLWPKTDGFHTFDIVPRVLGATHPNVFMRTRYGEGKDLTAATPRIKVREDKP